MGLRDDAGRLYEQLARWPVAHRAPSAPERPSRLDPPTLHDHTFRNPHDKGYNKASSYSY